MKRLLAVLSLLVMALGSAYAQPLTLDQAANVVEPKTIEIGIDGLTYSYDYTEFLNTNPTEKLTQTRLYIPIFARYLFPKDIEGTLTIPYQSLSAKMESGSTALSDNSDSKLSDIVIGAKKLVYDKDYKISVGLNLSLPTGSQSDKFPAEFRNGLNIDPRIAASRMFGAWTVDANLQYLMRSEFTGKDDNKYKLGDILTLGVGVEHACMMNRNITWVGEFVFNSKGQQSVNGTATPDTAGSQMDLVLGGRYNKGDWKTKAGIALSLGDEQFRDHDWQVILGATYLWKI